MEKKPDILDVAETLKEIMEAQAEMIGVLKRIIHIEQLLILSLEEMELIPISKGRKT